PCSRTSCPRGNLVFARALAMAREGSAGVEKTLSIRSWPPSLHTPAVKVPPVSIATRGLGEAGAISAGQESCHAGDARGQGERAAQREGGSRRRESAARRRCGVL